MTARTRLWCLPVLLCALFASVQAQDAPPSGAVPGLQLIAVPEDGGPVVRLTPDGGDVPWDAFRIGKFSLVDQNGKAVTDETLRGKPWVANFVFTRCAIECPVLMGKAYNNLHKRLKDTDFRIVTITVDPENDTVERMKKQSDVFGVDPDRWLFLTGSVDDVYGLVRDGFKQAAWKNVDPKEGMEFAHSLNMIHVDKDGNIVGKYNGQSDSELETLAQVLEGKIETPKRHSPVAVTTAPPKVEIPAWLARLPVTNAMLNTLTMLLLMGGLSAIKVKNVQLHKKLMLTAFAVSIAFLTCYLIYHFGLQHYTGDASRRYHRDDWTRPVYLVILFTHIVLAALVPFMAVATIFYGLKEKWDRHRKIAKVTYPIWMYVSVTGVVIYLMLYHL